MGFEFSPRLVWPPWREELGEQESGRGQIFQALRWQTTTPWSDDHWSTLFLCMKSIILVSKGYPILYYPTSITAVLFSNSSRWSMTIHQWYWTPWDSEGHVEVLGRKREGGKSGSNDKTRIFHNGKIMTMISPKGGKCCCQFHQQEHFSLPCTVCSGTSKFSFFHSAL